MKTFKLKTLFSVLICTGLLFSCSSDDDGITSSNPPTPNPRTGTPPVETTSLDLSFSANLDSYSEEVGCGEDLYLFQHSGQGSSDVTGAFSVDLSYCGQPESLQVYDLQLTIENANGDQIFLRQVTSTTFDDPYGQITDNGSEFDEPGNSGNSSTLTEDRIITLEITGGTGQFANTHGELSAKAAPSFMAGTSQVSFVFVGLVGGL